MAAAIKSAERALAIFEHFRRTRRPLGASEIGRALELPQSNTSMLLRNLVQLGYLDYSPDARTYLPTLRVALMDDWIHEGDSLAARLAALASAAGHARDRHPRTTERTAAQCLSVLQQEYGVQLTVKSAMLRPMASASSLAQKLQKERWRTDLRLHPHPGANMKPDSIRGGAAEIESTHERLSVSDAVICYQFVLDEIFEQQGRAD